MVKASFIPERVSSRLQEMDEIYDKAYIAIAKSYSACHYCSARGIDQNSILHDV